MGEWIGECPPASAPALVRRGAFAYTLYLSAFEKLGYPNRVLAIVKLIIPIMLMCLQAFLPDSFTLMILLLWLLQLFACQQLTDELSACLLRWETEMGRKYGLSRLFRLLQENASARLRGSQHPV